MMHEYERIRRAFVYGMSAIAYFKVLQPEIDQLQRVSQQLDDITTMMLKQGDLIPPISRSKKCEDDTNTNMCIDFSTPDIIPDVNGN